MSETPSLRILAVDDEPMLADLVVLATGWGSEIDQATARERGVEAVISKPYRGEALRRAAAG